MGFTQKYVCAAVGASDTSMVSHYEHSRVLPPLMTALSLEIIYRAPVASCSVNVTTSGKAYPVPEEALRKQECHGRAVDDLQTQGGHERAQYAAML